ncbi:MAG: STAS domain-containing protein [Isosphaeraceae bacterium]
MNRVILPNGDDRSVTTVVADGENLDAAAVARLREALLAAVAGPTPVVLDLSRVRFIDSSGLGLLVAAAMAARPGFLEFTGVSRRLEPGLARAPALAPFWRPKPKLGLLVA